MAYCFERDDASVQQGVRRIAIHEIEEAIRSVDDGTIGAAETVHQIRKCTKKMRGLIRLVRPAFRDYAVENSAFRDAAQALSEVRDSVVLIETYDAVVAAYKDQIDRRAFAPIRRHLTLRKRKAAHVGGFGEKLAHFPDTMVQERSRARRWQLSESDFEAIGPGLRKTHRWTQEAMAEVRKDPVDDAFHEWRKRVKYHWYHTRLLMPTWRKHMKAHCRSADCLGSLLGNHHDLFVLFETLSADPSAFGATDSVEVLLGLVKRRQTSIEAETFPIGERLLAEPAAALTERWRSYWDVWRHEPQDDDAPVAA